MTIDGNLIEEVRRDAAGEFPPLVYSELAPELSKAEYDLIFSLSDDFGNRRSFVKYLHVHADPPMIVNDQGLSRGPDQSFYADQDSDRVVSFRVRDASGIESLSIGRNDVELAVDFATEREMGPETIEALREISVTVEPTEWDLRAPEFSHRPIEVHLVFSDVTENLESIRVTAWDRKQLGGQREFALDVQCRRQDQSARWLGLDWIYIRSGDFYITRTEIPQWFYDRDEGRKNWMPVTNITPREMQTFAREIIQDVYLPTSEEWETIPGFNWVQAGVKSEVEKKKGSREWQALQAAVNCRKNYEDSPSVMKANQLDKLNERRVETIFGGVYHLLGNVQEVVEDKTSGTGFSAYGGSTIHTLTDCISGRFPVRDASVKSPQWGFRLVLYSKDSDTPVLGREKRVANSTFLRDKQTLPDATRPSEK